MGLQKESPRGCGPILVYIKQIYINQFWFILSAWFNQQLESLRLPCQHITWNHRHEILVTSWAQPKLTPTIYVTARDDRAKIAYHFFFFSQLIAFLWSKREDVGVLWALFLKYAIFTHTQTSLPIIPFECLDEGIKKTKLFPVAR